MKYKQPNTEMRRTQIRDVILRHRGSMSALARELKVTVKLVSMVLHGVGQSARVLAACEAKARELLKQEGKEAA